MIRDYLDCGLSDVARVDDLHHTALNHCRVSVFVTPPYLYQNMFSHNILHTRTRTRTREHAQAQSKAFFAGAPDALIALASSTAVLGMQWAGQGSKAAALDLLVASGAAPAAAAAAAAASTTTHTTTATTDNDDASGVKMDGGNSESVVPSKDCLLYTSPSPRD